MTCFEEIFCHGNVIKNEYEMVLFALSLIFKVYPEQNQRKLGGGVPIFFRLNKGSVISFWRTVGT